MLRVSLLAISVLMLVPVGLMAESPIPAAGPRTPGLSVNLGAGYSYPFPPLNDPYASGFTTDLRLSYRLPFAPRVLTLALVNYTQQWIDMSASGLSTSLVTSTADGGIGFTILDPAGFSLTPYAFGGWGWGGFGMASVYNTYQPEFGGGLTAELRLSDRFGVYGDLSYRWMRNLMSNGRLVVGARYASRFVPLSEPGKLFDVVYGRVFPAFYKYYETHPIAVASVINMGEQTIENLEITFHVADFMSNPQVCQAPDVLAPKAVARVEVYALFSPEILSVTQGATVQGIFEISYTVGSRHMSETMVQSVRVEDRNAMTWDDDERAAAFVTALDQSVLVFAKNSLASVDRLAGPLFDQNLLRAIALYHALGLQGVAYVPDPNTPHVELSVAEGAIDFLQFPRQTLLYGAGDCDDLSILYCSLLESVGTNTAFVTTPGHIFAAIEVGGTDQWSQIDSDPSDFILSDGKVWLPVETTLLRQGFDVAWRAGAEQWREYEATGEARLLPMQDSWATYEAVGFSSETAQVSLPDRARLRELSAADVTRIVRRQIREAESSLLARLDQNPTDSTTLNRLGVLYARYGLATEAGERFVQAVENREHLPGLINLGNLAFIENDYARALQYYQRALAVDTRFPAALLGAARCHYGLGDYDEATGLYDALAQVEPDLARAYDYVTGGATSGARATAAEQQWSVPWVE